MLGFREKVALQNETTAFVDRLLARLDLPDSFTLQEFCTAVAGMLGVDLRTYSVRMPSEIGGLGLSGRNGRTIILVNSRHSLLAEDYTILHELGHLALGHLAPGRNSAEGDELQADFFARVVLDRRIRRRPRRPSVAARLKDFFKS